MMRLLVALLIVSESSAWTTTTRPRFPVSPLDHAAASTANPAAAMSSLHRHHRHFSSTKLSMVSAAPRSKWQRAAKRIKDSLTSQERSEQDLKIGIAGFYDRSSKLWEGMIQCTLNCYVQQG
jgi:hypothetical protein